MRGFQDAVWRVAARPIVAAGTLARFTQTPAALLARDGTTLVEAAPWDGIWGIGLAADDPRAARRETWRGSNWLGAVLTDIREALLRAIRASGGG